MLFFFMCSNVELSLDMETGLVVSKVRRLSKTEGVCCYIFITVIHTS